MENGRMKSKKNIFIALLLVIGVRYFDNKVIQKRTRKMELMLQQRNVLDCWLTLKRRNLSIDKYLEEYGYKKVGIYGLSILGGHLYNELCHSSVVTRLIGIDRTAVNEYSDIEVFKPNEDFGEIDVIIVTALGDYKNVANKLRERYSGKIVSMQQVITECSKYCHEI